MTYVKKMKNRSDFQRFKTSAEGFVTGFVHEFTAKRIAIIGFLTALIIYVFLKDWELTKQTLVFTALAIFAELVNTSIEHVCDYVQPEKNEMIRKAKDVAAGGTFLWVALAIIITIIDIIKVIF